MWQLDICKMQNIHHEVHGHFYMGAFRVTSVMECPHGEEKMEYGPRETPDMVLEEVRDSLPDETPVHVDNGHGNVVITVDGSGDITRW